MTCPSFGSSSPSPRPPRSSSPTPSPRTLRRIASSSTRTRSRRLPRRRDCRCRRRSSPSSAEESAVPRARTPPDATVRRAIHVHDDVLLAASEALAEQATKEHFAKSYELVLANRLPRPDVFVKDADSCMYTTTNRSTQVLNGNNYRTICILHHTIGVPILDAAGFRVVQFQSVVGSTRTSPYCLSTYTGGWFASQDVPQLINSGSIASIVAASASSSAAMGAQLVFNGMPSRYIFNLNLTYSVDLVPTCSASKSCIVQKVFVSLIVEHQVHLASIRDSAQLRPLPWPSFSSYVTSVQLNTSIPVVLHGKGSPFCWPEFTQLSLCHLWLPGSNSPDGVLVIAADSSKWQPCALLRQLDSVQSEYWTYLEIANLHPDIGNFSSVFAVKCTWIGSLLGSVEMQLTCGYWEPYFQWEATREAMNTDIFTTSQESVHCSACVQIFCQELIYLGSYTGGHETVLPVLSPGKGFKFRMLNEDESRAVLLVFANKQDLPNATNDSEITDKLGLYSLRQRHWYIENTCAAAVYSYGLAMEEDPPDAAQCITLQRQDARATLQTQKHDGQAGGSMREVALWTNSAEATTFFTNKEVQHNVDCLSSPRSDQEFLQFLGIPILIFNIGLGASQVLRWGECQESSVLWAGIRPWAESCWSFGWMICWTLTDAHGKLATSSSSCCTRPPWCTSSFQKLTQGMEVRNVKNMVQEDACQPQEHGRSPLRLEGKPQFKERGMSGAAATWAQGQAGDGPLPTKGIGGT